MKEAKIVFRNIDDEDSLEPEAIAKLLSEAEGFFLLIRRAEDTPKGSLGQYTHMMSSMDLAGGFHHVMEKHPEIYFMIRAAIEDNDSPDDAISDMLQKMIDNLEANR